MLTSCSFEQLATPQQIVSPCVHLVFEMPGCFWLVLGLLCGGGGEWREFWWTCSSLEVGIEWFAERTTEQPVDCSVAQFHGQICSWFVHQYEGMTCMCIAIAVLIVRSCP